MKTWITKEEACELLGIKKSQFYCRIKAGEITARTFPSERNRGKQVLKVLLQNLPEEAQRRWVERCSVSGPETTAIVPTRPLGHRRPPLREPARFLGQPEAAATLAIGEGSTEPQLGLDFEGARAFRILPLEQQQWARKWFAVLTEAGILWNGDWAQKFGKREMRAGERVFFIQTKDDVMAYLAASHNVSKTWLYERRRELLEFFAYLNHCREKQEAIDIQVATAIFPARAKDGEGSWRRRRDAGLSRTIPKAAADFLLARYSAGSLPGGDGWKPTLRQVLYDYETFREALILAGENPEAHGCPEIEYSALRRLLPAAARRSDPALVLAREGSRAFADRIAPHIIRTRAGLFAHDWWVSDHRQANVWVRWSRDTRVIYRPWTTWMMDVRSAYPLCFVLAPIPSSATILRAFKNSLLIFRIVPFILYADCGKDYKAVVQTPSGVRPIFPLEANDDLDQKQLSLLERFGVEARHALPSRRSKTTGASECHARSKPIESFFGNWLDDFDRQWPGACGESPDTKPDKLSVELADPEKYLMLDIEYEQVLADYLEHRYCQHLHRELKMSPAQALERYSAGNWGLPERALTPEQIGFLMLERVTRRVRNSMVTIPIAGEKQYYMHPEFYARLNGQDVEIAFDPTDAEAVYAYHDGRCLGLARRVEKPPWGADPEAIGEQMKLQRVAVKSARQELARRELVGVPAQSDFAGLRSLLLRGRGADDRFGNNVLSARGEAVPAPGHAAELSRMRKQLLPKARSAPKTLTSEEVADAAIRSLEEAP